MPQCLEVITWIFLYYYCLLEQLDCSYCSSGFLSQGSRHTHTPDFHLQLGVAEDWEHHDNLERPIGAIVVTGNFKRASPFIVAQGQQRESRTRIADLNSHVFSHDH